MDLRKLKTLIDLVSDSNVSELEITEAEGKVRIVKGGGAAMQSYAAPAPQSAPSAQAQPTADAHAAPLAPPVVVAEHVESVYSIPAGTLILYL